MYIPGRLRTGSRPSRTVMSFAVYVGGTGTGNGSIGSRGSRGSRVLGSTVPGFGATSIAESADAEEVFRQREDTRVARDRRFCDQIQTSARSVAANLAEGPIRRTPIA